MAKVAEWEPWIKDSRAAVEDQIVVYSNGLIYCCACADNQLTAADVERLVNELNESGTAHGWRIAQEVFATGAPNPCPCNDTPGRRHWLLFC